MNDPYFNGAASCVKEEMICVFSDFLNSEQALKKEKFLVAVFGISLNSFRTLFSEESR